MNKRWIGLTFSILMGVGSFGLSQADSSTTDNAQHDNQSDMDTDMDHADMDHGSMNHGEHGAGDRGEALNVVLVGESSLTLEPLISAEGSFTLGIRVEPPAELSLNVTSPSGQEMALEAQPIMAKMDRDGTTDGQDGSDEASSVGMNHSEHSVTSDLGVSQTLAFEVGAAEAGVYRFSGTLSGAGVSFPISVYTNSANETDVYLVLAPSPALSTRGLAEAFVYAFKNGEPVHSGMTVDRAMAGMEHSTDDEQLDLVHNHFNDVYNDTLGYGPMANQRSLGFAMAGTWDVSVTVMGSDMTRFAFDVEVLDE